MSSTRDWVAEQEADERAKKIAAGEIKQFSPQKPKTLKDEFFMAALTGLLASGKQLGHDLCVKTAWYIAEESMKQRGEQK